MIARCYPLPLQLALKLKNKMNKIIRIKTKMMKVLNKKI